MTISVNWLDPYEDRTGRWYKGNLHTHTFPASSCAKVPARRMWELYAKARYDFIAISDHMTLTDYRGRGMVAIPAIEWNSSRGEHTGVCSPDRGLLERCTRIQDHAELLRFLADKDALVVLNHPNWQRTPHYRREQLDDRGPYDGIEIYNGVIERLEGAADSTDKWDYLLVKGRRVLGLASDDSHTEGDVNNAAVFVRSPRWSAGAILSALRRGNFYCSCDQMRFTDIRRRGEVVTVRTRTGQEIQAIGAGGMLLERVRAAAMSLDLSRVAGPYVRFAAYGAGSSMAWTQPFFKEP
jgi:hypothetical protein